MKTRQIRSIVVYTSKSSSFKNTYTYKNGCLCVCVCVCPGITVERLERFRPNLVHTLLYVCVRILCMFHIYSAGRMVREAGNLDDSLC
jgi:hypothetical protein